MAFFFILMEDYFTAREYGWTKSSDSKVSSELFANEIEANPQSSEGEEVPFARHGPVLEVDPKEISMQHDFWGSCAISFILYYRKFSVAHLQHIINVAWIIRGSTIIVGRDSYFYPIHFELMDDLNHICND